MTEPVQTSLLGDEPEGPKLGSRQQAVLDALRERGGLDADEAGALIHWKRGKHDEGQRCEWCSREGNAVLRSLRSRGLVVHRRGGQWEPKGARRQSGRVDPATQEIPY